MDDYDHKYLALAGGWFAGKTWAGARKIINLHVHNAFNEAGRPTYVKGLVIGQNYSLCRQINIPEIFKACDEMNLSTRFISDAKVFAFEFPDLGTKRFPSRLLVRSGESPETINGFTVGHIWGDETPRWAESDDDPTRDALTQAKGRLRDFRARVLQMMLTFTHEGDGTRVYRDFEEQPKPKHMLYRAGTFTNPFAVEFAKDMVEQLTPELQAQYVTGLAANFKGGNVYGAFDSQAYPAGNVNDKLALDFNLPLQLAVDFNIDPGMHGVLGQHWADRKTVTAVHELHAKSMSAIQMLEAFRSLIAKAGGWKFPYLELFGDPAGNGRFEATGQSAWDVVRQWLKANMPSVRVKDRVRSSHVLVADRVNAMNCALRSFKGDIHYQVHPRCERLIRDLKTLKWDGNEVNKKDRKLSHASEADSTRVEILMPVRTARFHTISASTP